MTKFTISALVNGVALDWTGDQFHENATPWHFETLSQAQRQLLSMDAEFLRDEGFQCDSLLLTIEQWGEDAAGNPTISVVEQQTVSPMSRHV